MNRDRKRDNPGTNGGNNVNRRKRRVRRRNSNNSATASWKIKNRSFDAKNRKGYVFFNPFFLFLADFRASLRKTGQTYSCTEESKLAGQKWREMSTNEKLIYITWAKRNREMQHYQHTALENTAGGVRTPLQPRRSSVRLALRANPPVENNSPTTAEEPRTSSRKPSTSNEPPKRRIARPKLLHSPRNRRAKDNKRQKK